MHKCTNTNNTGIFQGNVHVANAYNFNVAINYKQQTNDNNLTMRIDGMVQDD